MRKLMAATVAALLLVTTPAHADWPPTRWGMTVEQVVAAYPGAVTVAHNRGEDIDSRHLLARGTYAEGGIEVKAEFYFDSATRRLTTVRLEPRQMSQCQAYLDALVAREGTGKAKVTKLGDASPVTLTTIAWDRPPGEDQIGYSGAYVEGTGFMVCQLLVTPPG